MDRMTALFAALEIAKADEAEARAVGVVFVKTRRLFYVEAVAIRKAIEALIDEALLKELAAA